MMNQHNLYLASSSLGLLIKVIGTLEIQFTHKKYDSRNYLNGLFII